MVNTQDNTPHSNSNRVFIFTGPPGSGKTTTIEMLEREGYTVIHEAALDVINNQLLLLNLQSPENIPNLNKLILNEQRKRLQATLEKTNHKSNVIFCDRSQVCNLAYNTIFAEEPSEDLVEEINDLQAKQVYQSTVFFYELLPADCFKNNRARTETYDEAIRRGAIIEKTYLDKGYTLEKIPASVDATILSRQDRMKHILNIVFP